MPFLNVFDSDRTVISIHETGQEFKKVDSIMPVLVDPGTGPFGVNATTVVTSNDQDFLISYYGLPYIFVFDDQLKHKKTIRVTGSYIHDFFN